MDGLSRSSQTSAHVWRIWGQNGPYECKYPLYTPACGPQVTASVHNGIFRLQCNCNGMLTIRLIVMIFFRNARIVMAPIQLTQKKKDLPLSMAPVGLVRPLRSLLPYAPTAVLPPCSPSPVSDAAIATLPQPLCPPPTPLANHRKTMQTCPGMDSFQQRN